MILALSGGCSVELVDSLGNDLTVVNCARISFAKQSGTLEESDEKLLKYLAKHKHTSPYRGVQLQLKFVAPRVIARQIWKHIIGSDYTFKDTQWNEQSGRYTEMDESFYAPAQWNSQHKSNKQAAGEPILDQSSANEIYKEHIERCQNTYKLLRGLGVAKEQARFVLPETTMTSWVWTASLQACHHFVNLRNKSDAQWDIRQFAEAIGILAHSVAPKAWEVLQEHG
jgi:thymidylate synthase (FAD)